MPDTTLSTGGTGDNKAVRSLPSYTQCGKQRNKHQAPAHSEEQQQVQGQSSVGWAAFLRDTLFGTAVSE